MRGHEEEEEEEEEEWGEAGPELDRAQAGAKSGTSSRELKALLLSIFRKDPRERITLQVSLSLLLLL